MLRQLQHPHVVRLCDVVEMADTVYVVMERLQGPDLLEHIQAQPRGALAEPAAAPLFAHVLSALRHAHNRGFLHCDLKPANVRLDAACERAVLVDWGMARRTDAQSGGISQGTPAYASPEQLTGHNVGCAFGTARLMPATDVWGLGATLYEMVAGSPPFGGADFAELTSNVLRLN